MSKLVRLKPFNPRKGLVMRSYTYSGITIRVERGWHEVDDSTAEYLKTVHSSPENDESPLAFDVCTPQEAQALEDKQARDSESRASASNPVRSARLAFRQQRDLAHSAARGEQSSGLPLGPGMPPGLAGVSPAAVDALSGEFPEDGEGFDDEMENAPDDATRQEIQYARIAEVTPGIQEREFASNQSLPHAPDLPGQPGTRQNAAKRRGGRSVAGVGVTQMTHTGPAQVFTGQPGTPNHPVGATPGGSSYVGAGPENPGDTDATRKASAERAAQAKKDEKASAAHKRGDDK